MKRQGSTTSKASIALTSRARINENVVFRDLEGEMVLLDLKTGVYFGLDPIGTRTWQLIQEHQSLQKVRDVILGEYLVTEAQCEQDLLSFVAHLQEKQLVEITR